MVVQIVKINKDFYNKEHHKKSMEYKIQIVLQC